ncbi:unnamed protein product [Tilletia controversa]|nr:unnamed protein product [Tilletia controversa]
MRSLFDLPASLLIDSVLCHLSPADLTQLGATSQYARNLADADLVWARRLATDFHFPLHSSARPIHFDSRTGWKTIYARLSNPSVFVWGCASNDRLGQAHRLNNVYSVPFPIPVPAVDQPRLVGTAIRQSSLRIGPPVQLFSTGWAFFALTSSGHVVFWGCLDGENYAGWRAPSETEENLLERWKHPGVSVEVPTVLPIPPTLRVTQLGAGRKHALALARVRPPHDEELERAKELSGSTTSSTRLSAAVPQSQAVLLELQAFNDIVRIDLDTIGLSNLSTGPSGANADERTDIVQVEAGWEYSAVLVHRHQPRPARSSSTTTASTKSTSSDVFFWLTSWSGNADRQEPGRRLNSETDTVDAACSTLPTIEPVSVQLPPLPAPPPGLLTRLEHQRTQLKQSQDQTQPHSGGQPGSVPSALDQYYAAAAQSSSSRSSGKQPMGQQEDGNEQLITKIAAGTSFLIALTSKGLVYRIELLRGRRVPRTAHGTDHSENDSARAFRAALYSAWASGAEEEGWELLNTFCIPDEIAKCGIFAGSSNGNEDWKTYVDASIEITHISAHFQKFAAYSVAATSQLVGNTRGKEEGKSIVLLGDEDSTMYPGGIRRRPVPAAAAAAAGTANAENAADQVLNPPAPLVQPHIIPELQARSIIKVVQGDWHAGALDAKGHVVAWGQWANGALGVWDSLPLQESSSSSSPARRSTQLSPQLVRSTGGPLGMVRSAMGLARDFFAGPPALAEAEGEEEPGRSEEVASNETDDRRARRAAQRVVPSSVKDPLGVHFFDWTKRNPPAQFVFDLAMSGQHSGALTVDLDDGDARNEEAQRRQMNQGSYNQTRASTDLHSDDAPEQPAPSSSGRRSSSTPAGRPNIARQMCTAELDVRGRRTVLLSVLGAGLGIFGLVGGSEWLTGSVVVAIEGEVVVMRWPFSLGYFVPLLVPLSLYLVIARWTGDKLFRHS